MFAGETKGEERESDEQKNQLRAVIQKLSPILSILRNWHGKRRHFSKNCFLCVLIFLMNCVFVKLLLTLFC